MKYYALIVLSVLFFSCSQSRFVEPLKKNELAIGASLGGPIIDFGGPMPIPLSNIEVGYGLDTNLTVFGAWHPTSALFGNIQIDAGATYKILNQQNYIPNISVSPSFNFVYDIGDNVSKFWPILDLNTYWNYGQRKNYFYIGFNNYFELSTKMANDQDQAHHWIFNPQIGHVIKGKNKPWQFSIEMKFIAPYVNNSKSFFPYKSITGSWGATGVYIGFRRTLNFKK